MIGPRGQSFREDGGYPCPHSTYAPCTDLQDRICRNPRLDQPRSRPRASIPFRHSDNARHLQPRAARYGRPHRTRHAGRAHPHRGCAYRLAALVYRWCTEGREALPGLFLPRRVLPANQCFFMVSDAGFEPATPSLLGQTFPGRYCPVGKSRIKEQFWPFLAPVLSYSVLVRPAPVAARLQHLTLRRDEGNKGLAAWGSALRLIS